MVVISGGPGCACNYMSESHKHYADEGFRVVAWDQLGTGKSDRPADLHRVQAPVLIVSGEHDYILPEYAAVSLNYLPNARMKIFRGCSHMPMWEDPAAYHATVLPFLKGDN